MIRQRHVQQILSVICLLQVSHQLGRPINRKFHTPRKIEFVEQGWGLNIAPPPEPRPPRVCLNHAIAHSPLWLLPVCPCQLDSHLLYSWSDHGPKHASFLPSDLSVVMSNTELLGDLVHHLVYTRLGRLCSPTSKHAVTS